MTPNWDPVTSKRSSSRSRACASITRAVAFVSPSDCARAPNWATISGNLSIQALTGITQANPITVVGTSRFETSNSQIQLTQNNDFQDTDSDND